MSVKPKELIGTKRNYAHDHWSSDWNGDEVGFDNVSVVGLYITKEVPYIEYYVDTETGEVLDAWLPADF